MTASTESAATRKAVSVARARKGLKATDARALVRDKCHFTLISKS